ncbi:MAG: peptidylprolyl isomerase [Euryarchaeota archaeon]|nr:peptidylprolyl isomerase [Euryarchaeota archaeon]
MGCFAVELYMGKAPVTAGNFLNLTKSGFYDGTRFHRVIAGFMIQDGDPYSKDLSKKSQWGTGDPGYDIADEFPCKDGFVSHSWPADCSAHGGQLYSHAKVGTLSMANSGRPHDGGSQYFVMVAGQPRTDLDPKHPIFGVVVWNMSVVEAISRTPTGESDRPLTDVVNRSLKVL